MKKQIDFNEYLEIEKTLEIRVGEIISVEDVPKSDKLIKLTVNFGNEKRTVVTNIKPHLAHIQLLVGWMFPFVMNLKPVKMMGIESTAMILPGEIENGSIIAVRANPGDLIL